MIGKVILDLLPVHQHDVRRGVRPVLIHPSGTKGKSTKKGKKNGKGERGVVGSGKRNGIQWAHVNVIPEIF